MSPGEFMETIARALVADGQLTSWCVANLGEAAKVQVGVDEDNPPTVDDYPIIVLASCVKERGDARRPLLLLDLGCGLVSETITVEDNLKIYAGVTLGADFGSQVEAAVFRTNLGSFEVIGDHMPISFHPMHVTNTSIGCELVKSSRRPVR